MSVTGPGPIDLVLEGAERTYHDGATIRALHATDLHVAPGDHVAVVGPSGSGKSTLLNILALMDRPTQGDYLVGGVRTSGLSEPQRTALRGHLFGVAFQAYHLLAGRSLLDNVELGMVYGAVPRRERRQRAREALERVGLAERAGSDPRRLSGGQRQRVAIARALAARPAVLLCDEPTGNLDTGSSEQVLGLLDELNGDGLTLVVVTHDPMVAGHAPRVLELVDGRVTEIPAGTPAAEGAPAGAGRAP